MMRQAKTLMIGTTLGMLLIWAALGGVARAAQAGQSSQPKAQTKAPATPSTPAAKKPAGTPKPSALKTSPKKKGAAKTKKASAKPGAGAESAKEQPKIARRDPFGSLIGRNRDADMGPKLPGKAGLVINSLRLDGVVRYSNGMIAVVTNPQNRTYFLHEGDQLYDGQVAKIVMEGVTFREVGKDAFGKPVQREVSRRLNPSPGEPR